MLRGLDKLDNGGSLAGLVRQFAEIVNNRNFPCIYSAIPFLNSEIFFAEVATPAADEVVDRLRELCRIIDGMPDAVGVVFVRQPGEPTLADDFALAGRIVRATMHRNQHDHPDAVARGPEHPEWELELDGIGLFVNFSSPRHAARRSRNVGPVFTVIAQARESFDRDGRGSAKSRKAIRQRLLHYDDVPPHPGLGSFGDDTSREALQFFLGDGLTLMDPTGACLNAK